MTAAISCKYKDTGMHRETIYASGFAAIVAAMLVTGAPANAQTGADVFDKADLNGDGKITRAEFDTARESAFRKMDRNGDGVLAKADFPRASRSPRFAEKFGALQGRADVNHDGVVSRAEYQSNGAAHFGLADSNHDGAIDRAELEKLRSKAKNS